MQSPFDFKTLGEFISGLLIKQKKEIVEEVIGVLRKEINNSENRLRNEIKISQVQLRKEIKDGQEIFRKEIKESEERTIKGLADHFADSVLPLLGEHDVRLEHQEAHTTHPPRAPVGI